MNLTVNNRFYSLTHLGIPDSHARKLVNDYLKSHTLEYNKDYCYAVKKFNVIDLRQMVTLYSSDLLRKVLGEKYKQSSINHNYYLLQLKSDESDLMLFEDAMLTIFRPYTMLDKKLAHTLFNSIIQQEIIDKQLGGLFFVDNEKQVYINSQAIKTIKSFLNC